MIHHPPGQASFYGWRVVGAAFVVMLFAASFPFFAMGVFMPSMARDLALSRGALSIGAGLSSLLFGVSSALVGSMLARVGIRPVMMVSCLVGAAGYALLTFTAGMAGYLSSCAAIGVATAGLTFVPCQTLIANWFEKYRGRAIGLMMVGYGIGGLSIPPLSSLAMNWVGWRSTTMCYALVYVVILLPIVAVMMRGRPSDLGQSVDGLEPTPGHQGAVSPPDLRLIRRLSFWMIVLVMFSLAFGQSMLIYHFVAMLNDAGFTIQGGANALGLMLTFSLVASMAFGWVGERRSPRALVPLGALLNAVSLLGLVAAMEYQAASWPVLVAFVGLFGSGIGVRISVMPLLVTFGFGRASFSRVFGLSTLGAAIGMVVGPVLGGAVFDRTGSYSTPFVIASAVLFLATLAAAFVAPERHRLCGQCEAAQEPQDDRDHPH